MFGSHTIYTIHRENETIHLKPTNSRCSTEKGSLNLKTLNPMLNFEMSAIFWNSRISYLITETWHFGWNGANPSVLLLTLHCRIWRVSQMRIYYPCFVNKRVFLDNRRPNRFEVNAQTQFQAVIQQVSTHPIPTKLVFIRNGINKMLHGSPCPISLLFLPYKYYILSQHEVHFRRHCCSCYRRCLCSKHCQHHLSSYRYCLHCWSACYHHLVSKI